MLALCVFAHFPGFIVSFCICLPFEVYSFWIIYVFLFARQLQPVVSVISEIINSQFHLCTDSTLIFVYVIRVNVGCPFQYLSTHMLSRIWAADAFIFWSTVMGFFSPFKCCKNDIVWSVCGKINSNFKCEVVREEKNWAMRSKGMETRKWITSYEFKHGDYGKFCLWAKVRKQIALEWSVLWKQMASEADITEVVLWAQWRCEQRTKHKCRLNTPFCYKPGSVWPSFDADSIWGRCRRNNILCDWKSDRIKS